MANNHSNEQQEEDIRRDEIIPEQEAETENVESDEEQSDKAAEWQDKYLRLAAEFDNFRKRTLREKTDLIQTAGESVIKELLPVVDDFERGLEVVVKSDDMDAVKTGMSLIYNKLKDFLASRGVCEIAALNEPFNADTHEAVTNIPAPSDDMKGKVMDVIQKGYVLHDKIIRYPKVVVGE
ncbi:MAG: nucleotide exchange factor GrpE [Bacteroidales bacterium]|jgi:molecular chaperone GrpE|nr:nucleotide exchange factor GrpE [Bacteroidales bacterium]